jgi:hypothetical protein
MERRIHGDDGWDGLRADVVCCGDENLSKSILSDGKRLCFEHFSTVAVCRKHVSIKYLQQQRATWETQRATWETLFARQFKTSWPTSTSASPDENNPLNLDRFMSEREQMISRRCFFDQGQILE